MKLPFITLHITVKDKKGGEWERTVVSENF